MDQENEENFNEETINDLEETELLEVKDGYEMISDCLRDPEWKKK